MPGRRVPGRVTRRRGSRAGNPSLRPGKCRHGRRANPLDGLDAPCCRMNRLTLQILTWWRQEGGQAITFASDAHDPAALAAGFADAAHLAEAAGFAAGHDPCGPWGRSTFPV
jgi:hypothetical protein